MCIAEEGQEIDEQEQEKVKPAAPSNLEQPNNLQLIPEEIKNLQDEISFPAPHSLLIARGSVDLKRVPVTSDKDESAVQNQAVQ